ncbi:MAG: hypothetical protein AB7T31_10005 [Gemmatimonadales bacterium]
MESHRPTQYVIELNPSGSLFVARGLESDEIIAEHPVLDVAIELAFDRLRRHAPCEITIPDGRQWHLDHPEADWRAVHRTPL